METAKAEPCLGPRGERSLNLKRIASRVRASRYSKHDTYDATIDGQEGSHVWAQLATKPDALVLMDVREQPRAGSVLLHLIRSTLVPVFPRTGQCLGIKGRSCNRYILISISQ